MPPPQRLATSCSPPSRSSPPPRSRRRLIRGARLPPRSRRDRFRPRPAPVAGGFRSRTATATASSPRMPAGVPDLPERSGSVTARSGDTQLGSSASAATAPRWRDAGHRRPARAHDRPAPAARQRRRARRERSRARVTALGIGFRPGRASATSASASARTPSTSAARRSRTTWPRAPTRPTSARSRRGRPAAGLPAARRRHLLPGAVAALHARLRRARRQHRDELLPAGHRLAGRLERRGAGAPPNQQPGAPRPGSSLRVFAGPDPARGARRFTAATGRQPQAGRAVVLRPVVPAERR